MFSFISYCIEIKIILSCRVGLCDPPTQWKVVSFKLGASFQLKLKRSALPRIRFESIKKKQNNSNVASARFLYKIPSTATKAVPSKKPFTFWALLSYTNYKVIKS